MNNQQPPPELRWEHNVALLTNRFVLFDLFKIMGITYVLIVARLHCTPEQYPEVAGAVRECLLTGAADRDKTNSKPARA